MPKLTRITNKIFGQNATAIGDNPQIGQFGSAKAGTYIGTTDVETIQELSAWSNGWVDAVTPQNQFPALPEMTAVHKVLSRQTAYLYQEGIPEHDINTTYFKGSLVKSYSDENGIKIYYSKIDENINHSLEDTTAWEEASLGGGSGGLEIGDIGTALYVNEAEGKRRRLNGSILDINDNTRGFVNWLKAVIATTPSLATTEENWQSELTLSKLGQCGKFVIDEEAGTIRLPKVVNINGLQNLAQAGVRIDESLPNITANIRSKALRTESDNGTVFSSVDGALKLENEKFTPINGVASGSVGQNETHLVTFNASRSSSTYQDNAPVQQEAIQYPYFIQIATGAETQVNIINDIELNNPYTLFDSKYSDHQIFNASWLRSEGQYNSKAIYVKAYEALQVEYNSEVEVGEAVTLPSGTSYTKQGLSVKLSTESYDDYDYVLSTSDETFRLPIKSHLASGKAVVGNGIALGLTDGTDNYGLCINKHDLNSNLFNYTAYGSNIGGAETQSFANTNKFGGITTDPTKSGIELSDSNLYLYYYVGETVQNANLIDAGRIAEVLATKTDLPTATASSFPSVRYIDLELGASGSTYTAPANGYMFIRKTSGAADKFLYIGGGELGSIAYSSGTNQQMRVWLPVTAGRTYTVQYTSTGRLVEFKFIYAEGAN